MTDKEAIDNLKDYIECLMEDYGYYKDIVEFRDSVEHLEKSLQTQQTEIEKQDKIIDLMSEQLAGLTIWNNFLDEPLILGDKEEVKQYFGNKVNSSEQN